MAIDSFHLIRALDYVDRQKARSAWARGVKEYARELLGNLLYWTMQGRYLGGLAEAEEKAMQGAGTWERYSRGGLSLTANRDIAERLCSPSALKRAKGGQLAPNRDGDWIDVQARALSQAWDLLRTALVETAPEED